MFLCYCVCTPPPLQLQRELATTKEQFAAASAEARRLGEQLAATEAQRGENAAQLEAARTQVVTLQGRLEEVSSQYAAERAAWQGERQALQVRRGRPLVRPRRAVVGCCRWLVAECASCMALHA